MQTHRIARKTSAIAALVAATAFAAPAVMAAGSSTGHYNTKPTGAYTAAPAASTYAAPAATTYAAPAPTTYAAPAASTYAAPAVTTQTYVPAPAVNTGGATVGTAPVDGYIDTGAYVFPAQ